MEERDDVLINYAKASGAFQYAANRFLRNRDMKDFLEAQSCINNLINRELPKVEDYCNQHAGEEGIDSLLEIAKADYNAMHMIFKNL